MSAVTATGKVIRLYANRFGTFIRLDIDRDTGPKERYFRLMLDHPNYNALYSLALAAAANRWPIIVRIMGDDPIRPEVEAVVSWLVVDWEAGQDD